jgi:DNA-directed RNA polymerase specialized sigma24 family protein
MAGDMSARDDLCRILTPLLRQRLVSFLVPDTHIVDAAIDDALLFYVTNPARFTPVRGSLIAWLSTICRNRVRDEHRSNRRRLAHERTSGFDLSSLGFGLLFPDHHLDDQQREEARLRILSLAQSARERAFLDARCRDEPIAVQAQALGLGGLTIGEQRRGVYRTVDAIIKRTRRKVRGQLAS